MRLPAFCTAAFFVCKQVSYVNRRSMPVGRPASRATLQDLPPCFYHHLSCADVRPCNPAGILASSKRAATLLHHTYALHPAQRAQMTTDGRSTGILHWPPRYIGSQHLPMYEFPNREILLSNGNNYTFYTKLRYTVDGFTPYFCDAVSRRSGNAAVVMSPSSHE